MTLNFVNLWKNRGFGLALIEVRFTRSESYLTLFNFCLVLNYYMKS
jgi:hypothetical protein